MIDARIRTAIVALATLMPVAMHAQRGMGPGGGRMGGNPVAPLIDMRRELNLSARQLTQLDSIERSLLQRNRTVQERIRSRMDSVRPRLRADTGEARQALRVQADSMRALRRVIVRNDSTAREAAMRILTDSQRIQVRVRAAERRGFNRGRASAMREGQRGFRQAQPGPQGRRMQPGQPGGRMGMAGPGMRQSGGLRGPDGIGPRFEGRRPPMAGEMAPRRRGMMGDSIPPGEPGPRRRPPADSGR